MHLVLAGSKAEVDGYIGYFEPYATSHEALDRDRVFQAEVQNAALALMEAVEAKRAGRLVEPSGQLKEPRPKLRARARRLPGRSTRSGELAFGRPRCVGRASVGRPRLKQPRGPDDLASFENSHNVAIVSSALRSAESR
jgi:hypothetical protein